MVFQVVGQDAGIGFEDASVRRLVIGFHIPRAAGADGREARVQPPNQDVEVCARLGQVAKDNIDAPRRDAAVDLDNKIVAIVGDICDEQVVRAKLLAVKLAAEDQRVF